MSMKKRRRASSRNLSSRITSRWSPAHSRCCWHHFSKHATNAADNCIRPYDFEALFIFAFSDIATRSSRCRKSFSTAGGVDAPLLYIVYARRHDTTMPQRHDSLKARFLTSDDASSRSFADARCCPLPNTHDDFDSRLPMPTCHFARRDILGICQLNIMTPPLYRQFRSAYSRGIAGDIARR